MPDFVTLLRLLGELTRNTAPSWLLYNLGMEPGLGLRPQSDEALRQVIATIKRGGEGEKVTQAALRTPRTIKVESGKSAGKFSRANKQGTYVGGQTGRNMFGSEVSLYPDQMAVIGRALGKGAENSITPHELVHAIRFNKELDTGNANIEESVPRVGLNRPIMEWAYRKFSNNEPMTVADLPMLKDLYGKTLK